MFHPNLKAEEGVLHVIFEGKIEIHEILNYIKMLGESHVLPRDLNILNDFRKAEFSFKPTQIPLIGAQMKKYEGKYNTVRIAAVYANPKETAYGQLIEQYSTLKNYTHKIFHSCASAEDWLKVTTSVY
jgi:hypothetical protein